MAKKNIYPKLLILILFVLSVPFASLQPSAGARDDSVVLFDDFNRAELGVTGTGGAYNSPNSFGIAIYWISMNEKTKAQIENNALRLTMDRDGWYGEGVAFKDPAYRYIIMKIKGEQGGEEKLLSLNPDAKGLVNFTDIKGPGSQPLPAITKDYQDIVIDTQSPGFNVSNGFEAIHFNNTGALTVYIDEIYLSKDGVPKDISKILSAADEDKEANGENGGGDGGISDGPGASIGDAAGDAGDVGAIEEAEAVDAAETSADSGEAGVMAAGAAEKAAGSKTVPVAIIVFIMAAAIGGITYNSFIRKT